MASVHDLRRVLTTDSEIVVIQVLANDPRSNPTEVITVGCPAHDGSLAELDSLATQLRDKCEWGFGYEEELRRSGGGIGAEGATIVSLVLGVVGTVPTVRMIFDLLAAHLPACPERDEAMDTATWAVALQYEGVARRQLVVVREARDRDHWTFWLQLADAPDAFEVEVYGSRSGSVATRVVWTNGDAWSDPPGNSGLE